MIDANSIGSFLIYSAFVLAIFSALASVVGKRRNDGRLLLSGERAGYAVMGVMICAAFILINAFVEHDYANKYVARYSDNNMPWYYLVAAFWGGQAGSLMFWTVVLGAITGIVIWQNREQNRDILPTVIAVLMVVQVFFLGLMIFEANPFEQFRINEPPINGRGLEPLLQNPAMTFHPPSILSGYVWFTVPFAFAIAALVHRRLDAGWIRSTRRYAIVSWGFLSVGNLFGGMWAYEELGWGGFWGWDPVENASLMPWFTATAYLHSVMIQERRGMLRVWNFWLVIITYFLTVFGTFLTRSGLIDSVHTFAQSDIGGYFMVALPLLLISSIGVLCLRVMDGSLESGLLGKEEAQLEPPQLTPAGRWVLAAVVGVPLVIFLYLMVMVEQLGSTLTGQIALAVIPFILVSPALLRGLMSSPRVRDALCATAPYKRKGGHVDSLFSREGVFLLNNFVLVGCVGVVLFGTLGEKISAYFWQETKYTAPWFNTWMVPGGLALLLLMGVGPLIPWRKTSWPAFKKNFLVPLVVSLCVTAVVYLSNVYHVRELVAATHIPIGEVPLGRLLLVAELNGVYSLIGFAGSTFIIYTLLREYIRGALVRRRRTKESLLMAFGRLFVKNKRRYGGYLAHLGFAGLFLGFIGTGLKTEKDLVFNAPGVTQNIEDKQLTFKGLQQTQNREYSEWFAEFDVHQLEPDGSAGALLGTLYPSRRSYHGANVKLSRQTTEKDEIFLWKGNVYLALVSFKPGFKTAEVMAHYNPMILFMWLGGALLLFGVVVCLWPEAKAYPVFAAASRRRKRPTPEQVVADAGALPREGLE